MYPHFLGIGAQKAGTSWLNKQLLNHPDIWQPPMKEIHYHDSPSFPMIFLLASRFSRIRKMMRGNIRAALKNKKDRTWYLRYYCLPRNDTWYASLFSPNKQQLAGEITPKYAKLPEAKIENIYQQNPQLKIIYLLRNPVERSWSQLGMEANRFGQKKLKDRSKAEILDFLNQANNLNHGRYLDNLKRWQKYFPKEQIFIGFFEQIKETPQQFLNDIFQFLEVSPFLIKEDMLSTVVGKGNYLQIPDTIKQTVNDFWLEDVKALHLHFNNRFTLNWLKRLEKSQFIKEENK